MYVVELSFFVNGGIITEGHRDCQQIVVRAAYITKFLFATVVVVVIDNNIVFANAHLLCERKYVRILYYRAIKVPFTNWVQLK